MLSILLLLKKLLFLLWWRGWHEEFLSYKYNKVVKNFLMGQLIEQVKTLKILTYYQDKLDPLYQKFFVASSTHGYHPVLVIMKIEKH